MSVECWTLLVVAILATWLRGGTAEIEAEEVAGSEADAVNAAVYKLNKLYICFIFLIRQVNFGTNASNWLQFRGKQI